MGGWRTTLRAKRRRDQQGASAVEFALIVPLVIALLFASITFGFMFFHYISVNDSVRAGARFGGTTVNSSTWPDKVRAQTVTYSAGNLEPGQVCVQLVKGPAASTTLLHNSCALSGASATPPGTPADLLADECVVKVWAARADKVMAPPLYFDTITLRRGSVTRYERDCVVTP